MRFILLLFFITSFIVANAQIGRVEQNERVSKLIDRYEVKYGHFSGFMGLSPKFRTEIDEYFFLLDSVGLSPKELYDRQFILENISENREIIPEENKSFWQYFYQNKAYLFQLKKKDFWISLNPILNLKSGIESDNNIILQNTRGVRLKGSLGKSIYFSSAIYENQAAFQQYHTKTINRLETIPGQSFYKPFDFNIKNQAFDFLNSDGFVGLRINKFSTLELGHGRQFVGHGIRSILLSDFATNYLYLRANTRVWKFNYQNLFTELTPFTEKLILTDVLLPKKYMAQHLLSFKVNQRIELGIFETVVFSRDNQFELQYLNPIIFYRTVEQFLNSSDNVLLGLQAKWNIVPGNQVYGQFILDDFNITELRKDINWWGNKYGLQLGYKAIDVLKVDHLDMQFELNLVRPYTYTHRLSFEKIPISKANYSHFSQSLAHPLGANFVELLYYCNYRIYNRLTLAPRLLYAIQGVDPNNQNFGSNILLDNTSRQGDANQNLLQGERVNIQLFGLNTSYECYRNVFVDLQFQYRNSVSNIIDYNNKSLYLGIGIRLNYLEDNRDY